MSIFEHTSDQTNYDPEPALSPEDAEAFLDGVHAPETSIRDISEETIAKMNGAIKNIGAMPKNPSEQ